MILNTIAHRELTESLSELSGRAAALQHESIGEQIELARACLEGVFATSTEWVDACCNAKGLQQDSRLRAEEVFLGPMTVVRQLWLIGQTLEDLNRIGKPCIPGQLRVGRTGSLEAPIFPVKGMCDRLIFPGFHAHARFRPGVQSESLFQDAAWQRERQATNVALVLGAGNASSIPATDALGKIFQQNQAVLLKLSPVNAYLRPIFERAFSSLVNRGYLRIVCGGADIGSQAVANQIVDTVHVTGAIETHDNIVWGPPGPARIRRQQTHSPVLNKPITSELGNVSPWIVAPGKYRRNELRFQAENIAASIVNNASFSCATTRVIITWKEWDQRDVFLDTLQEMLDLTPQRVAYYPGAIERYREFTGREPQVTTDGKLPWTLMRDVNSDEPSILFQRESFVCVCAEVPLGGRSETDFLHAAVDFANEKLWGTLCAAITIRPKFRQIRKHESAFRDCLDRLRYGCVGINQWPGLMYAFISPPWGGHPSSTLADAQSGIGWVHNTYRLQGVEKTVLEGPIRTLTKPTWFPTHDNPEPMAWAALRLYKSPSPSRLPMLLLRAHCAKVAR
jgi:hypothetical protein